MSSQLYRSTTSTSRIKKDASRVGYGGPRGRQIIVKDETGQDVTPLPLVPRQAAPQAGKPLGESRTAVTMIQSASDIFGMNQLDGPKGLLHVPDSARVLSFVYRMTGHKRLSRRHRGRSPTF